MKTKTHRLRFLFKGLLPILILLCGSLAYIGIGKLRAEPDMKPLSSTPLAVEIQEAVPSRETLTIHSQGVVEPTIETELHAAVSGRIIFTHPRLQAGGIFKKGDELLSVEPTRYQSELAKALADLARAKLDLAKISAQAEQAKRDWKRLGQGVASDLALYEPQLQEAHARVEAARAACSVARLDLERSKVLAPFNCRIRKATLSVDQDLKIGDPLVTLFTTDSAEVRLPIRNHDLFMLDKDIWSPKYASAIDVTLSANFGGKLQHWPAQIVRSEGVADRNSNLIYLVAKINEPYNSDTTTVLPMGQFVEAVIYGRTVVDAVRIPEHALLDGDAVLIVDRDDRLVRRTITVLQNLGTEVLLGGGVRKGERICISTLDYYLEGTKVTTNKSAIKLAGNTR